MKLTSKEKFWTGIIRYNEAKGIDYVYRFGFRLLLWKIEVEQRRKNNLWGRFGGGWNWEFGILVGSDIIINYLVGSVRISRRKKNEGEQKCQH